MKQLITCFLLLTLSWNYGISQICPPGKQPVEEEVQNADVNETLYEPARFDPENIPLQHKRGILRLGYGVNAVVSINQNELISSRRNLDWFNDRVAHVFDLSGEWGAKRKWATGFSFSFQKLATMKESRTYSPNDYLPASQQEETISLTAKFDLKAHVYSPMIYTEYQFLNFWKYFSGIAHFETGISIYRAQMSVSYQDTCGCEKVPVSDWEMATSFNAGLGIGLKWEYRWVGFKTMLTYQSQTKVNFKRQEDYQGYSFGFDPSAYDFKGAPADSRFSLLMSGDSSLRRYSPLYFQFILFFRIGSH